MNCHEISKMLAEGAIDRDLIELHLSTCADCRQKVEFDRWLGDTFTEAPALNPEVLSRVRERASRPTRPGLLSKQLDQGASIMRKTIWTTATAAALAIGTFAILSTSAQATSPKAKFTAMKKALAARQERTMVSVTMTGDGTGQPKMKVMINGQLVDVPAGVPFEYHDGNKKIIINSSTNLDDLTPEQRAQMEKIIQQGSKGGRVIISGPNGSSVSRTVIVNGRELKGKELDDFMKNKGIKFSGRTGDGKTFIGVGVDFTLDEKAYSNMKFGKDENTLFLTPRTRADVRYALAVDPKTNLPTTVTLQKSKAGKWTSVNSSKFQYKPKAKK
jgi:hypothetical protein